MCLITRQGFPTATQSAGMERVTTLPAPMTLLRPIVTPGKIMAPPPIHTLSSIFMGSANVLQMALLSSQFCMVLSFTFVECVAVYICTLEAIKTLLPISIRLLSTNVQFMLIMTLLPTNIFFPYSQRKSMSTWTFSPKCPNISRKMASFCFVSA